MTANERIPVRISNQELERRWTALRRLMRAREIDALIVQATNDWLGGNVKWLTDIPANNGYPRTLLFYADDFMTVVQMGIFDGRRTLKGDDPIHRGVGTILTTPSFPSIGYSVRYDAELALTDLREHAVRRVGFANGTGFLAGFSDVLREGLGNVEIVDMTEELDALKAIKSPEEQDLIRRTAALQDEVFAHVCTVIRPGLRDIDVTSAAQMQAQRLGSEQGILLGASAQVGVRSPFMGRHFQGRSLSSGDHLSLLVEVNGPGGFFCEIARTLVLGKASAELHDGFAAVKAAQEHTLSRLKPGASARDIAAAHDDYMTARGLPPETRLYAHSQGYDMVERPLIRRDETMTISPGMHLAVHPGYETETLFAVICDNYLVGEDGPGPCLHRTEKKIFEL
ncbi:M24 family metallopeptidase [Bradyrhizobium sp.]|uniref:M24 family metallopeptidase n=1 Tax=Bradyrhizobium sp. TaxID=376 RepID=UPI001D948230|nr:M24 family metallopeptidase [Bradyrhizobium sp.]MBV8696603.1 aminopeptidase P family protein [Bradyrhizobium sp.]MBV8918494.1 aminopeptidase P family protein [Bradyrhizobium sp.]